ncbi:MAG TPA: hypothetical protein VKT19_00595 [Steroidobacteraceae bacterium]|nr:hypothetical protein [Steroidobacteraceae bacterium]
MATAHDTSVPNPAATTVAPPSPVPRPEPGSARYFVLLYTPSAHREALSALLAIADELAAGLVRGLDHGVAHLRLQWWEDELRRLQLGSSQHPWLLGWARERAALPALEPLLQAARIDLADRHLAARAEMRLPGALFVSVARVLGLPASRLDDAMPGADEHGHAPASERGSPSLRQPLEWLGSAVGILEAAWDGQAVAIAQAPALLQSIGERQREAALIEPACQPMLSPLLLWLALAAQRWQRRERRRRVGPQRRPAGSATMAGVRLGRFDALADNFIAWRAARRALRHRFRVDLQ